MRQVRPRCCVVNYGNEVNEIMFLTDIFGHVIELTS